jgi:hypothetical protein
MKRFWFCASFLVPVIVGCPGPAPYEHSPLTVNVSPDTATVDLATTRRFTATVIGSSLQGVEWSVSGRGCSGNGCGTISATGLYTAPDTQIAENSPVIVKAVALADDNASGEASVTLNSTVAVVVAPATRFVDIGGTLQVTAQVTGSANREVVWSVVGSCMGAACGMVDANGLYTAPAVPPNPPRVAVKATARADVSRSASSNLTITSTSMGGDRP